MDKNEKGFSFRKSMRGFNKDDVIKYISDENRRFMAEKSLLESKLTEAEWTITEGNRKADEMKNSFDAVLDAKNDELSNYKSEIEHLKAELEASAVKQKELLDEGEKLRTLINGCEQQLTDYSDKLSKLEAENSVLVNKASYNEDIKSENEYLREKYKALELEFRTLSEKLRELENTPTQYQSPRESKEEPFQKRPRSPYTNKSEVTGASQAGYRPIPRTAARASKEDTRTVSDKAINSIRAIHDDVQSYMNNCVGEFDTYSRDVIDSITKLIAEIEEKCSQLQNRIAIHKQDADRKIDRRYTGYGSELS